MTGAGPADRTRRLVRVLRRRVRFRTRLRRIRETWRRLGRRRLPAWSDRPATVAGSSQPGRAEVTVDSPGALPRYAAGADPGVTVQSLRLVVTDWRAPYPGWSGQVGPLPGLVRRAVCLPPRERGRATVAVDLVEPLPLPQVVLAAWQALAPANRLAVDRGGTPAGVAVADPRGRDRYGPGLPAGRLRLAHRAGVAGWEVVAGTGPAVVVVAGRAGEPLDDRQRAVLAELGTVAVPDDPAGPPAALAQVLAQLAMTGVVVHGPVPDGLLARELAGLIREPLPGRDAGPLAWEVRSVRQRRAAMRHYAVRAGGDAGPPAVSALLVTKRPHRIGPAVAALAAQTYPELEVVVGVHGGGLPAAGRDRLTGPVVTIPPERNLGEALAEATSAARGQLVTKVDDDDRYGPEHVWDVVLAWLYSGATVSGKGAEFVYVEPKDRTVRRRMGAELFTDTVAGGTLTLARDDLAAVGGWPPVPRWVDRALLDRVLAAGGLVYRTHPFGFLYTRHGDGHTWDAELDYFLQDPRQTWDGLPSDPELG